MITVAGSDLQEGGAVSLRKEVAQMITYEALFAFCMVIIGVIGLCLTHKKK